MSGEPHAKPIMLVADNGPLGALAIAGADKLDCLLQLGIPLHISDMVIEEATRNESPLVEPRHIGMAGAEPQALRARGDRHRS